MKKDRPKGKERTETISQPEATVRERPRPIWGGPALRRTQRREVGGDVKNNEVGK